MVRNFSDRVLGGVCGGAAQALRLDAWLVRAFTAVLAVVTGGGIAALYVLLWWIVPLGSPAARVRRVSLFIVLLLTLAVIALWVVSSQGLLRSPQGTDLYYPILGMALALAYAARQIGGRL
jgi:phage shock protein PspC (stress-responsive transcriptional regulator)